jgi:hypothetical protein
VPGAAAIPSEIAAAFAGAQRGAVLALLRHRADEQLDEVYPSDLDVLDRRIAQLEALDAPAGPPRAPADELPGYRDLPVGLIAAVEAAHRIELHRRDGDDYVLEVTSCTAGVGRWRATRHEILAAEGAAWRSLGGYLLLDGEPLADAPVLPRAPAVVARRRGGVR